MLEPQYGLRDWRANMYLRAPVHYRTGLIAAHANFEIYYEWMLQLQVAATLEGLRTAVPALKESSAIITTSAAQLKRRDSPRGYEDIQIYAACRTSTLNATSQGS